MNQSGVQSLLRRPASRIIILVGASAGGGYIYRKQFSQSKFEDQSLNPHTFTPYSLVSKQAVSSTSSIFTLRPQQRNESSSQLVQRAWRKGVWSVEAKQPQLQIARSYTPLPSTDNESHGDDIRILIRREEGGEVSNYLHNLADYASIDIRGPHLEVEIPETVKDVLFLAGGTGIAPAMQVARTLAEREGTRLHILWANRKREECVGGRSDKRYAAASVATGGWKSWFSLGGSNEELQKEDTSGHEGIIVLELDKLKKTSKDDNLVVTYFVDEERRCIHAGDILLHMKSMEADTSSNKLIFVSGPDGFVEHLAGKKIWVGGQEAQGPLGGVLARMKLTDWKVWKL